MSIEKAFVYSNIQIQQFKSINKSVGRDFKCGSVSIGSRKEPYSAIIDKDKISDTRERFPDLKVVHIGTLSGTTFTKISNEFLKG